MQRDRPLQMMFVFILVVQSLIIVPTLLSLGKQRPHTDENLPSQNTITSPEEMSAAPIDSIGSDELERSFSLADTGTFTGALDPIVTEQKGYYSTDNISARTDINSNLAVDLPIDDAHEWKASEAEIDVWNITSLYAINGTYDSGVPGTNVNPNGTVAYYPDGWNATSNSTDIAQLQTATYDDTGNKFVSVENQGKKIGASGKRFEHIAGTEILWTQNVSNVPYTNDFYLSFSYVYLRGPQGPAVPGNCSLTVFIDGLNVWNISLLTVPQRGIWYETGRIPITTVGLGSVFNFSIGLVIDENMDIHADSDYGDGIAEGVVNVLYITSYIDDVSFIGVNQPTPEAVDLQFTAGSGTVQIAGSAGSGSASIANQSYWISSPVPASITSNGSISLTYRSRLLSHRFDNSSWTTDNSKLGVSYSIQAEMSAELAFFTYLGSIGDYQEFALRLHFPIDWENSTILDPFQGDVTSSCSISAGLIEIPSSAIGALGWWQINAQAPNYAREIVPQLYDSGIPQWENASTYRPGNLTRATISIGYASTIPAAVDSVNVSWFLPDGTPWFSELVSGGVNGKINSTGQTLDNSAAGAWRIEALWTNGTEVAYGGTVLDVYHKASLTPIDSIIETDFGLTVTSRLVYTDLDTSSYIMNDAATIEGNYSAGIVAFAPNVIKNWWSADLDTSLLGAGQFTIFVNATFPFFDNASCSFMVVSTNVTRLSSPNAPWSSGEWGTNISLTLNYEVYSYSGDSWGPVTNGTSDTRINVNWTAGKWSAWEDVVPGIYILRIDTSAKPADAWLLNITITKPSHEAQQLLITLLITPEASTLAIMGDTSAQVDLEEEYNVTIRYTDSEGDPVAGATVAIDSVTPPAGLLTSSVEPIAGEPGNYTVSLTPQDAGVFTVRFVANASDTQTANTVFVLVVSDVGTSLTVTSGESAEIGLTDTFTAEVHFETYNGTGIESASISVVYSGPLSGIQWAEPAESSEGNYSIDFNATLSGTYLITIGASKQYYQSSSTSFFLVVGDISTTLVVLNGTAGIVSFGSDYRLVVHYTNGSGYGLTSADVDVVSSTPSVGLGPVTVTPDGLGYFSMVLSPQIASTYTILIRANLTNHETQFGTFTLTVTPIPTYLTVLNSSVSISVDQNFTVFFSFQNESFYGLEGASFSTLSMPDGYLLSSSTDLSMGLYSIMISPLEIGTFDIVFRASLTSHQNATAAFTIHASLIPTALITEGGINTNTTLFQDNYDIIVHYERTDLHTDISNAILDVDISDDEVSYLISELSVGYRIRVGSEKIGRFTVTITAQRDNHVIATTSFILDVQQIPTSLTGVSISQPLIYGHSHSFTFSYLIAQNQSRIHDAEVAATREGYEWVYPMSLEDGRYNITVVPEGIAAYSVLLTFTRDGFQSQSFTLSFEVESVPVQIDMTSPAFGMEGTAYTLTIELFEASNPQVPVTNAQLSYKLSLTGFTWVGMTEETPGTYNATIALPIVEGQNDTTIEFFFLKSNHVVVGRFQFGFSVQPNQFVRMLPIATGSGVSIGFLLVAILARRSYNKKKRKRNLEAMAIKERFDDARNIIGLIVLHKKSGLPFYSKAMKGGFDEGMISAFITAITHFRAEFGMDEKHWDFQVIPISDIISAVPTRSMVCAFVTGFSPSESQQIKMQAYGRAAGAMFDEIFSDTPSETINGDTYRLFESLFMDLLDVRLLKPYRRNESVAFPRSHKCMEITMPIVVDEEGFRLDELAKGMASCGVEEGRAYILVMDAIAKGLIESTVPEEPGAVPFIDREGTELPFDESPL